MAGEVETGVILKAIDQFSATQQKMIDQLNGIKKASGDTGAGFDLGGKMADKFGMSVKSVGTEIMTLMPMLSVVAVGAWFVNAIKDADQFSVSMERLGSAVNATGASWGKNKKQVTEWAEVLMKTTRFSDDELISSLQKTVTATGDLAQSQDLVKLAMDISAKTGDDMSETLHNLTLAFEGNQRGIMALNKEFSGTIGPVKDASDMLNKLRGIYDGASESSNSLATNTKKLQNTWSDFGKSLGQEFRPAADGLLISLRVIMNVVITLWKGVEMSATNAVNAIVTASKAIGNVLTLHFKDAFGNIKEGFSVMGQNIKDFGVGTAQLWEGVDKDAEKNIKKVTEFHASNIAEIEKNNAEGYKQMKENGDKMVAEEKARMKQTEKNNAETVDDMKTQDEKRRDFFIQTQNDMAEEVVKKNQMNMDNYNTYVQKLKDMNTKAMDHMGYDITQMFMSFKASATNFDDFWKKFTDGLAQYFEDKIIEYLAKKFFTGFLGSLINLVLPGMGSVFTEIFGGKASGGPIAQTGQYILHQGEYVVPNQTAAFTPTSAPQMGNMNNSLNANITINASSGDPVAIAEAVGRELQRQVRGMGQTGMVSKGLSGSYG